MMEKKQDIFEWLKRLTGADNISDLRLGCLDKTLGILSEADLSDYALDELTSVAEYISSQTPTFENAEQANRFFKDLK